MRRILCFVLIVVALTHTLHAQIQVGMSLKRQLYMMYEPIIATITITNLSGRDLPLTDADDQHWFGFEILRVDGMPVAPLDPNYKLTSITIPAGQTVKRSVDLNALYPVHDFGLYRIRAAIYFSPRQKFFESRQVNLEISEGKTIWQQTVGVPDGEKGADGTRKLSLLTFRQPDRNMLYVRVEDIDNGIVYCTLPLGRMVDAVDPQIQLDVLNNLHVLQVIGAKTYLYSRIRLSGEVIAQHSYVSDKTRPALRRDTAGEINVVGGQIQEPNAQMGAASAPDQSIPKLSDRPVELPKD